MYFQTQFRTIHDVCFISCFHRKKKPFLELWDCQMMWPDYLKCTMEGTLSSSPGSVNIVETEWTRQRNKTCTPHGGQLESMNEVSLALLLYKTILKVSALVRFTQDRSITFHMCLTTVSPLYSLSICSGFFAFLFLFLLKSKIPDITQALPLRRVLNTSPWRTGSYIHILLSQHTSLLHSKYGLSLSQDYSPIYNPVAFLVYSQFSTPMP